MTWWERLSLEMSARNLSPEDVASRSGVPVKSVYGYLKGDVENPRGDTLRRLANAVHMSEQQLRYAGAAKPEDGEASEGAEGLNAATCSLRELQASRLREARQLRGFPSGSAAARRFGWGITTYNKHENGERGIGRAYLEYATTFKVNPAWLLGHSDERDVFGADEQPGHIHEKLLNRIRELREQAGLTQEQLAKKIGGGTTKMQISRLESGKIRLTQDWMRRLAEPLRCKPADLMSDAALTEADEVQPASDYPLASALASKGLRVYTVTEAGTQIVHAGIRPGDTILVQDAETAETGNVVLVCMANNKLALRCFLAPNLLVTNRQDPNSAVTTDHPTARPKIVGVVVRDRPER